MAVWIELSPKQGEVAKASPIVTLKTLLDREDQLRVELRRVRRQIQAKRRAERAKDNPKPKKAPPKSISAKLKAREISYTVAKQRGLI